MFTQVSCKLAQNNKSAIEAEFQESYVSETFKGYYILSKQ